MHRLLAHSSCYHPETVRILTPTPTLNVRSHCDASRVSADTQLAIASSSAVASSSSESSDSDAPDAKSDSDSDSDSCEYTSHPVYAL